MFLVVPMATLAFPPRGTLLYREEIHQGALQLYSVHLLFGCPLWRPSEVVPGPKGAGEPQIMQLVCL
jgi:hypothetical protein